MADRGILFSAPMVRALLAGRKTQTRRKAPTRKVYPHGQEYGDDFYEEIREPIYAPGDRLWVREAWRADAFYDDLKPSAMGGEEGVRYEADGKFGAWTFAPQKPGRLRPGMFMPRWSSRLTLTVTEVRVERLQEISEADAIAEGITQAQCGGMTGWLDYAAASPITAPHFSHPKRSYASLWSTLHTKPGECWEDNPWVVAVSFTVRPQNIDTLDSEGTK